MDAGAVEVGLDGDPERPRAVDERAASRHRPRPPSGRRRRAVARAPRAPVAGGDEQRDPLQRGQQRRRVVRAPDVAVVARIAPDRVRRRPCSWRTARARGRASPAGAGRRRTTPRRGTAAVAARRRPSRRARPSRARRSPAGCRRRSRARGSAAARAGGSPPRPGRRASPNRSRRPRPRASRRARRAVGRAPRRRSSGSSSRRCRSTRAAGTAPASAGSSPARQPVGREEADLRLAAERPRAHREVELARRDPGLRDDGAGSTRRGRGRRGGVVTAAGDQEAEQERERDPSHPGPPRCTGPPHPVRSVVACACSSTSSG